MLCKMEDIDNKEDGLNLILEFSYTLTDLRDYIKDSCLAGKCKFLEEASEEDPGLSQFLCTNFVDILKSSDLNLNEITTLYVVACMLLYIQRKPYNFEWRMYLLQKVFCYTDTIHPLHLHTAAKRMWNALKREEISAFFSIMNCCSFISLISETGKSIALCLIWTIVAEITSTDFPMYSFHEISELGTMLEHVDDALLQEDDKVKIVYLLVRAVAFIVNEVVFTHNKDLKMVGYRKYFQYKRRHLKKIKEWSERLCDILVDASISKPKNFYNLRMTIKEYVNFSIVSNLQEKLAEMQVASPDKT